MRRLLRATVPLTFALAACGERHSPEPVSFVLQADSLVEISEDTLPDGSVTSNCSISFNGSAEGPAGESVIMRGGSIQYYWWTTGTAASKYEWTPDAISTFWIDSIIDVGEKRVSREHGFGQSSPPQLVRAEVVFRYATTNNDSVRTTPPFRFYCF
jgi:hypothetical protein